MNIETSIAKHNSVQMKNLFFSIFLILFSLSAFSQNYFIKTDILGPVISKPFVFSFEKNNGTPNSFVLNIEGGWYMRDKTVDFSQLKWKKRILGFGIMPEYRYYFRYRSKLNKPVGFFAGGYGRINRLWYKQDFTDNNIPDIKEVNYIGGLGGLVGYKYKRPYSKYYFEVLAGYGLGIADIKNYDNDYFSDQHLLWRLEVSVGYAFQ